MHVEFLVEDSSGQKLLEHLVPLLIGEENDRVSYRFHHYGGIGHLPRGLRSAAKARKRLLLSRLPSILKGYAKTPGIDAVVVVLDSDRQDCVKFLTELRAVASGSGRSDTLFRIAIEEIEAWYLGDREAIKAAYSAAKLAALATYTQDSICGTWERLADAVYPGGAKAVERAGWPTPGNLKHEWAERIAPHLQIDRNVSPSFRTFCEGVRRVAGVSDPN